MPGWIDQKFAISMYKPAFGTKPACHGQKQQKDQLSHLNPPQFNIVITRDTLQHAGVRSASQPTYLIHSEEWPVEYFHLQGFPVSS